MEQASLVLGRLDGITELLPDVDLFITMYAFKEAVLSSQLEGTQATMAEAIKAQGEMRSGVHEDVDDILRHIEAMNDGLKRLEDLPLSMRLIKEIHKTLMAGDARKLGHVTPGEFRTSQNWVGGGSPTTARFVPPPPGELRRCLGDLELFLHAEDSLPIAIKAGLAHAQFETIHPFLDGNGRTGRLLITFYFCQQAVLSRPVLYLSEYFKRNRETYFDRLQAHHDRGEVLGWLEFFLEGIAQVGAKAVDTCRMVTKLVARDSQLVSSLDRSAPKALLVQRLLYKQPIVSVRSVQNVTGLSRPNANILIDRLVKVGLLTPSDETVAYGRTFVHEEYLSLFREVDEVY